jgi:hypothetical protein
MGIVQVSGNNLVDNFTASGQVGTTIGPTDSGTNYVAIEITGVWTGTLSFFGFVTAAGQTALFPLAVYALNTASSTVVTTATANGLFRAFDATGISIFVKATAAMTGTANVSYVVNSLGGGS